MVSSTRGDRALRTGLGLSLRIKCPWCGSMHDCRPNWSADTDSYQVEPSINAPPHDNFALRRAVGIGGTRGDMELRGLPFSEFSGPRKRGRPRAGEVRDRPWETEGISRAAWYRRQQRR